MTPEQVREIASNAAESAAEKVAEKAAEKAVRATLIALGIDVDKLHEEQRVWAFARTMQQGTQRGVFALITGFATTAAATIAGSAWYVFFNKPHP
jgi:hypothetical protein